MLPKLSIIVPVYNVEKYVEKCIKSILCQIDTSKGDVEVIIIDDGSTDVSPKIVAEIIAGQRNVILITQKNKGLSAARNEGLSHARGEYVWFIDSDDYIGEDAVSRILPYLENGYDVLSIVARRVSEEYGEIMECPKGKLQDGLITKEEWILRGYVYPYSGAQFYLYRRGFLEAHRLTFKEGVYFEDILFTPNVICEADGILHITYPIYYYREREGSITQSNMTLKKWNDILIIGDSLNDLSRKSSDLINKKIYNTIISTIAGVNTKYSFPLMKDEDKSIGRELFFRRRYWMSSILNSYKPKYLLRYLAFLLKNH